VIVVLWLLNKKAFKDFSQESLIILSTVFVPEEITIDDALVRNPKRRQLIGCIMYGETEDDRL
jgi:hypothetical protein